MGRHPTHIPDNMRAEILRRMAAGEGSRSIARDVKIPESTLRRNFSAQVAQVQSVANKIVSTEKELAQLSKPAQTAAQGFANQLRAITDNVARALQAGSETAAHLHELARDRAKVILREELQNGMLVDHGVASDVADLQIMANRALLPALRMIVATRETTPPPADDDDVDLSTLTQEELDQAERLALKARGELA